MSLAFIEVPALSLQPIFFPFHTFLSLGLGEDMGWQEQIHNVSLSAQPGGLAGGGGKERAKPSGQQEHGEEYVETQKHRTSWVGRDQDHGVLHSCSLVPVVLYLLTPAVMVLINLSSLSASSFLAPSLPVLKQIQGSPEQKAGPWAMSFRREKGLSRVGARGLPPCNGG